MINATSDRVRRTRTHVQFYKEMGWQPLPSDPTPADMGGRKKPLVKFRDYWESPAPDDLFDRFPAANIQVMTGTHWRLAVLDLDGREAIEHVEANWPKLPKTWTVYHSNVGRVSRHHWFRLPGGLEPKGKQLLHAVWNEEKAGWKKHVAVELLLDRNLVTAPPSIHIKTGREYTFTHVPKKRRLAELPEWVWRMEAVRSPARVEEQESRVLPSAPSQVRTARLDRLVTTEEVLQSIPDKVSLVRSWGLRVTTHPGTDGWLKTHDYNRDDSNPSASFHPECGRFWRPGMHRTMSLFDISVELGIYRDWKECKDALAEEFLLSSSRSSHP